MGKEIEILEYIKKNPGLNLKEILINNNITEITLKKTLFDLLSKKLIKFNNSCYFDSDYIFKNSQSLDNDTFFGVYVLEEHKKIINYLFQKIIEYWKKSKNQLPTNTQIYKVLVEINKNQNLNLPIVWYKFGQIPAVSFNFENINNLDLNYSNLISDNIINNIVIDNIKYNSFDIKLKQYHSDGTNMHTLYSFKEKITDSYYKNDFKFIKDNFNIIFTNIPYFKDENNTVNQFYEFISNYNKLDRKLQLNNDNKDLFYKTFESFWNILAIQNFIVSLKEYYKINNIDTNNFENCLNQLKVLEGDFNHLIEDYYYKNNNVNFL